MFTRSIFLLRELPKCIPLALKIISNNLVHLKNRSAYLETISKHLRIQEVGGAILGIWESKTTEYDTEAIAQII